VLFPLSKTRPSPSLSPHASSQSYFFRGIEDTVPLPLIVATPPIIASEHLSCHHPTYTLSALSAQRDRWWFFLHYRALLPHSPECCGSRPWYKEAAPPQLSDFLAKTDANVISNLAHVQRTFAPRPLVCCVPVMFSAKDRGKGHRQARAATA